MAEKDNEKKGKQPGEIPDDSGVEAKAAKSGKKKMPPLPEGASQSPVKQKTAGRVGKGIDNSVKEQRARARRKAQQLKSNLRNRSTEEILGTVVTSAAELQAATQEISSSGQELASTMDEISSAARQAAAATAQSTSAVAQVLSASQQSREATNLSLQKMEDVERLVQVSVESMGELVAGINMALNFNTTSAENVRAVQENSRRVRETAQAVASIAEQINLFAFNAALEASRAGEFGGGFSIVSDEVRALAQQAAAASANIDTILEDIDGAVVQVVGDIEKSVTDSRAWADEANALAEALSKSTSRMTAVRQSASEIDVAATELANVMQGVDAAAGEINEMTEQAESAAVESSSVLVEQQSALRGIQDASDELLVKTEAVRSGDDGDEVFAEIGTITDELSATIQEAASSAEQINAAVSQIARAADVLAAQAEANVPVVQRARSRVGDIAQRAASSENAVTELRVLLVENAEKMNSVVENVGSAAEQNLHYAANIKQLQAEVLRIDEVIDSLISISVMTNLLSVSGRIEGVRAGESGAGFTTVSEDIRQLAQDTTSNVSAARRMIRDIQLAVSDVVTDLEKAGVAVRSEADKANRIASQLLVIDDDMAAILSGVLEISAATAEAEQGIPQIEQAIESIAQASNQTAAAMTEASSAASEQSMAMSELADSVDDLAMQLGALKR